MVGTRKKREREKVEKGKCTQSLGKIIGKGQPTVCGKGTGGRGKESGGLDKGNDTGGRGTRWEGNFGGCD